MLSSKLRQELLDLLSHPSIVGPHGVPPGGSEFDIQTFEEAHGLRLPPTLRDWFSVVNGAFCGTQSFLGLNDHGVASEDFLAKSWLPVATDGCGNYYLIDLTGPDQGDYPVFFSDHETAWDVASGGPIKSYAVASNVWIFSLLLLKHELARVDSSQDSSERWSWPFDRDPTLQHDPNLALLRSAPLPWKADGAPVCRFAHWIVMRLSRIIPHVVIASVAKQSIRKRCARWWIASTRFRGCRNDEAGE